MSLGLDYGRLSKDSHITQGEAEEDTGQGSRRLAEEEKQFWGD